MKVYSDEFRRDALRLLETSGKSVREIEEDLGLTAGLLYQWRRRYSTLGYLSPHAFEEAYALDNV